MHRDEPHYFGSRSGLPVTDLHSPQNHSASRMIQAGDTAECISTPMYAWHDPQLASQHETYSADQSQGYDIAGCVHSDFTQDLAQVTSNDGTNPSEDQYRTHSSANTPKPSEARISSVPSQQVLGSTVSQTETNLDVSKLDPDELKVLVPDQTCHCATCLDGHRLSHNELRWCPRDEAPAWTARTFSCRVTGCQWTTKDESHWEEKRTNFGKLLNHEGYSERGHHYGKPGEWRCPEVGCKFVTKRWKDFLRHSTSKHCIKPKDLKCPFLECKYHHIDFSRKDKLKSHVDKVHKGTHHPGKPNQTIKPKPEDHA